MKPNALVDAIRELTGLPFEGADALELGPGAVYLLELPNRRIRHIHPDGQAFPRSFYNLTEAADSWDELVALTDRDAYAAAWDTDCFDQPQTYRIQTSRRGETQQVQDFRVPLRDARGELVGALGRLVDDSFRSMAMDALMRRSWKEVSTAMMRRLLHDFNNTIAGIYSLSELYAELGSDPQSMTEAMEHIRSSSVRAQEITRRIRHLVTLDDGEPSYFDLCKLLQEQDEYLQALLPKGAQINYRIEAKDAVARLDANRFRQAILHLASNAADAAGESVAIELVITVEVDERDRHVARIEMRDNGIGFDADCLEKAVTPFYTTKDASKHPGLGLNAASAFAQSLDGSLAIANGSTGGACVTLRIPLEANAATASAATPKPASAEVVPAEPARRAAKPADDEAEPTVSKLPKLLVYTWEDITRHPLLLAMREAGWNPRIHLDPGQLLIDLSQNSGDLDGVIVFKSALDERADPLLSELGHAKGNPRIALVALGESVEALSEQVKRNCGLVATGTLKPKALLHKLAKFYT